MCKSCGCETAGKPVKYRCTCPEEDCECDSIIEFEEEPKETPLCCGLPMKKIE